MSAMSCLRATSDQPEGGRCSINMLATTSPRCDRSPTCMSNRCASLIVIVNPSVGRCTAMCAGPAQGGNGGIRNGLKVFGSGELVLKTDVLGVQGEFRSGFQCFCAFRRRSESLQPFVGFTGELSQLRVSSISVTGTARNWPTDQSIRLKL